MHPSRDAVPIGVTIPGAGSAGLFSEVPDGTVAAESSAIATESFQHRRIDVAAGDDGDVQFCFWQLIGSKEESSGRDCAAGLGHRVGIGCQKFHGFADLVFGDGDDAIDKTLHVIEVDGADALGA